MLLEKAEMVANFAHRGQYRKDGTTPYISHPEAVAGILLNLGIRDENVLSAAWLHDTMEDCGLTREYLEREFNPEVGRIVAALTRDVGREAYKERISGADFAVQIVKLADVAHNCSTLDRSLPPHTVANKAWDCEEFYLPLARRICPPLYEMILSEMRD